MFLALHLAAGLALAGMSVVPAGNYTPLYGPAKVHVASFSLDDHAVTRAEFLEFVRSHPDWRRGAIRRDLAEPGYLDEWRGDLDAGDATDLRRPVTSVSRFAAEAYCAARGKRLPTVDEWEYAAARESRSAPARLKLQRGPWEWTASSQPSHHHTAHVTHDASCAGAAMGAQDPTNYAAFQRFAVRSALTDTTTLRALGFRCAA